MGCYLVEWYRRDLVGQPLDDTVDRLDVGVSALCAEGAVVRRLMTMAALADEVLYSLFAATSADVVSAACQRAGLPADRLIAEVSALF